MQAYHVSLQEAMNLTLPQMIMLNHAAHINYERAKKKADENVAVETEEIATWKGKPVEKCNSTEWGQYFGDFSGE